MVGSMLIGAWLLIHHQCCAVAEKDSRMRSSLLVEQLTRRSNLEKNFMRFGRSSIMPVSVEPDPEALASSRLVKKDSVFSNYNRFARARANKNGFIRFGRNKNQPFEKLVDLKENLGQETKEDNIIRPTRAKEDFLRFGRGDEEQKFDEFSRSSRAKQDFMRFGRSFREIISGFNRPARAKQDFMRFGRGFDERSEDFNRALRGNEAVSKPDGEYLEQTKEFNRPSRSKQDFMRFGRSFSKQPIDFNRPMRAKDNFMRFGRQFFPTYEYKRPGRAREDFMRFGRAHQAEEEPAKPSKLLESKEESKEMNMKKRWHRDHSEAELDNETTGHGANDVTSDHGSKRSGDSREGDVETEADRLNLHLKKPDDDKCVEEEEEEEDMCMKQHSDFLRFSRSDNRPVVRSQRGKDLDAHFIRFGRALPSPFQPGFIVGPELTILPPLHFKQSRNDASNSMRLG